MTEPLSRRARIAWWTVAIAGMVAEFVLSSIPGDELARTGFDLNDKVAHGLIYACIAAALRCALSGAQRPWLYAALIAAAYGGSDELHQLAVPHRDASVGDLIADAIGASLGAAAAHLLLRRRGRPKKTAGGT